MSELGLWKSLEKNTSPHGFSVKLQVLVASLLKNSWGAKPSALEKVFLLFNELVLHSWFLLPPSMGFSRSDGSRKDCFFFKTRSLLWLSKTGCSLSWQWDEANSVHHTLHLWNDPPTAFCCFMLFLLNPGWHGMMKRLASICKAQFLFLQLLSSASGWP